MLNDTYYILVAGNPQKWDDETRARCRPGRYENTWNSEDLCKVQIDQHRRGRRSATIVETIYGWSLRSASNLDGRQIIASRLTRDEAIAAGTAWANEDPDNREFFIRR